MMMRWSIGRFAPATSPTAEMIMKSKLSNPEKVKMISLILNSKEQAHSMELALLQHSELLKEKEALLQHSKELALLQHSELLKEKEALLQHSKELALLQHSKELALLQHSEELAQANERLVAEKDARIDQLQKVALDLEIRFRAAAGTLSRRVAFELTVGHMGRLLRSVLNDPKLQGSRANNETMRVLDKIICHPDDEDTKKLWEAVKSCDMLNEFVVYVRECMTKHNSRDQTPLKSLFAQLSKDIHRAQIEYVTLTQECQTLSSLENCVMQCVVKVGRLGAQN